ncbi:MAG: hypothetical protein J6A28_04770 [Clostridia bacterium]|nr:hypothetical protein [Clostridia bacterium]
MYTLNNEKTRLKIDNFSIDIDEIDFISMEKMKKDAPYQGYCVVFHKDAGKRKTYFKDTNSRNGLATYDNFKTLADLLIGEGSPFVEISGVRLLNKDKISGFEVIADSTGRRKAMIVDFGGRKAEFVGVRDQDIALLEEAISLERAKE